MSFHHVSVRILFAVSLAPLFLIIRIPSYAHAALPAANSATKNPQEAEEDQFQESLYLPDDPLLQLNISTFNSSIYGKPKGILVEFYSSWCGHCINFAPLWRTFAKDVEAWYPVVEVAAVNCALDENLKLCRQHDVNGYPALKYFKYDSKSPADSWDFEGDRESLTNLRKGLLKLVLKDGAKQHPDWPDFNLIHKDLNSKDISAQIFNLNSGTSTSAVTYVAVIFEKGTSLAGAEALLDLSGAFMKPKASPNFAIKLAPAEQEIAKELKLTDFPALIIFKRGEATPIFVSNSPFSRQQIVTEIVTKCGADLPPPGSFYLHHAEFLKNFEENQEKTSKKPKEAAAVVHLADLLSGLGYILRHEIAAQKFIEGEKFLALKKFLSVLSENFPGKSQVKSVLRKLTVFVESKNSGSISGEDWANFVEKILDESGHPIPSIATWFGCKGSEPRFRGYCKTLKYPCSLWTLFHSLTVQAYIQNKQNSGWDPKIPLEAIHGYVWNFFGCRQCAENFEKEAKKISDSVKNGEDAVLWLWEAHNKANARLHGDPSEDPAHPKIQFPSPVFCPKCKSAFGGSWDRPRVLEFLLDFYTDIKTPNESLFYKLVEFADGKRTESAGVANFQPDVKNFQPEVKNSQNFRPEIKNLNSKNQMDLKNFNSNQMDFRRFHEYEAKKLNLIENFDEHRNKFPQILGGWFQFSSLDFSLCFVLWFGSLILLIFCYLYMRSRGRIFRYKPIDYKI